MRDVKQDTVISKNGIVIRLTHERWQHIIEQHNELSDRHADVLNTVAEPERILAGNNGELMVVRAIEVGKWLIVVYREFEDDGFIITAFLTRRHRSLETRTVLWFPSNNT